jgi:glycosyltransferase involved in cell wall biosynthesis
MPLGRRIEHDGHGAFYFPKQTEFYKVSLPFRRWMATHVKNYDLITIHAVFSYLSVNAAYRARAAGVPYIIIPHGVLNRWGVKNRRPFLKALSLHFVEKPILRVAAAMYYTSRAESLEAAEAGASARAVIIPHGIDATEFQSLPNSEVFFQRFPLARGRTLVLFLSRLDAKKGLDLLLPAFAALKQKHPLAMLVVVGSGEAGFVRDLKTQANQLGIQRRSLDRISVGRG